MPSKSGESPPPTSDLVIKTRRQSLLDSPSRITRGQLRRFSNVLPSTGQEAGLNSPKTSPGRDHASKVSVEVVEGTSPPRRGRPRKIQEENTVPASPSRRNIRGASQEPAAVSGVPVRSRRSVNSAPEETTKDLTSSNRRASVRMPSITEDIVTRRTSSRTASKQSSPPELLELPISRRTRRSSISSVTSSVASPSRSTRSRKKLSPVPSPVASELSVASPEHQEPSPSQAKEAVSQDKDQQESSSPKRTPRSPHLAHIPVVEKKVGIVSPSRGTPFQNSPSVNKRLSVGTPRRINMGESISPVACKDSPEDSSSKHETTQGLTKTPSKTDTSNTDGKKDASVTGSSEPGQLSPNENIPEAIQKDPRKSLDGDKKVGQDQTVAFDSLQPVKGSRLSYGRRSLTLGNNKGVRSPLLESNDQKRRISLPPSCEGKRFSVSVKGTGSFMSTSKVTELSSIVTDESSGASSCTVSSPIKPHSPVKMDQEVSKPTVGLEESSDESEESEDTVNDHGQDEQEPQKVNPELGCEKVPLFSRQTPSKTQPMEKQSSGQTPQKSPKLIELDQSSDETGDSDVNSLPGKFASSGKTPLKSPKLIIELDQSTDETGDSDMNSLPGKFASSGKISLKSPKPAESSEKCEESAESEGGNFSSVARVTPAKSDCGKKDSCGKTPEKSTEELDQSADETGDSDQNSSPGKFVKTPLKSPKLDVGVEESEESTESEEENFSPLSRATPSRTDSTCKDSRGKTPEKSTKESDQSADETGDSNQNSSPGKFVRTPLKSPKLDVGIEESEESTESEEENFSPLSRAPPSRIDSASKDSRGKTPEKSAKKSDQSADETGDSVQNSSPGKFVKTPLNSLRLSTIINEWDESTVSEGGNFSPLSRATPVKIDSTRKDSCRKTPEKSAKESDQSADATGDSGQNSPDKFIKSPLKSPKSALSMEGSDEEEDDQLESECKFQAKTPQKSSKSVDDAEVGLLTYSAEGASTTNTPQKTPKGHTQHSQSITEREAENSKTPVPIAEKSGTLLKKQTPAKVLEKSVTNCPGSSDDECHSIETIHNSDEEREHSSAVQKSHSGSMKGVSQYEAKSPCIMSVKTPAKTPTKSVVGTPGKSKVSLGVSGSTPLASSKSPTVQSCIDDSDSESESSEPVKLDFVTTKKRSSLSSSRGMPKMDSSIEMAKKKAPNVTACSDIMSDVSFPDYSIRSEDVGVNAWSSVRSDTSRTADASKMVLLDSSTDQSEDEVLEIPATMNESLSSVSEKKSSPASKDKNIPLEINTKPVQRKTSLTPGKSSADEGRAHNTSQKISLRIDSDDSDYEEDMSRKEGSKPNELSKTAVGNSLDCSQKSSFFMRDVAHLLNLEVASEDDEDGSEESWKLVFSPSTKSKKEVRAEKKAKRKAEKEARRKAKEARLEEAEKKDQSITKDSQAPSELDKSFRLEAFEGLFSDEEKSKEKPLKKTKAQRRAERLAEKKMRKKEQEEKDTLADENLSAPTFDPENHDSQNAVIETEKIQSLSNEEDTTSVENKAGVENDIVESVSSADVKKKQKKKKLTDGVEAGAEPKKKKKKLTQTDEAGAESIKKKKKKLTQTDEAGAESIKKKKKKMTGDETKNSGDNAGARNKKKKKKIVVSDGSEAETEETNKHSDNGEAGVETQKKKKKKKVVTGVDKVGAETDVNKLTGNDEAGVETKKKKKKKKVVTGGNKVDVDSKEMKKLIGNDEATVETQKKKKKVPTSGSEAVAEVVVGKKQTLKKKTIKKLNNGGELCPTDANKRTEKKTVISSDNTESIVKKKRKRMIQNDAEGDDSEAPKKKKKKSKEHSKKVADVEETIASALIVKGKKKKSSDDGVAELKRIKKLLKASEPPNMDLHDSDDSNDAPAAISFSVGKEAALAELQAAAENIRREHERKRDKLRLKQQMILEQKLAKQGKKKRKHSQISDEASPEDSQNSRFWAANTSVGVKRLPDELLQSLSDHPSTKVARLADGRKELVAVTESAKAQQRLERKRARKLAMKLEKQKLKQADYIPLEAGSSTATRFGIVPLRNIMKSSNKTAEEAVNFRKDMLFGKRVKRTPVTTMLAHQEKLKAAGKDSFVAQ